MRPEERPRSELASKVVALVGSAGALGAFRVVLQDLPEELAAPVVVVLHLHEGHRSLLASILARRTVLAVKQAEAGDELEPGHVYVAPPGAHLLVTLNRTLELGDGPRVGSVRPSADVLLTSLALAYGRDTLAVIMSGAGHDGAAGASAVKLAGGAVIAQDRESAEYFGMPGTAIAEGAVDRVLPVRQIGAAIVEFVRA
jgi:two-component system chemotaxis response regulator CheB